MNNNPWEKITSENRISALDKNYIENNKQKLKDFNFKYFPEPFIWDKDAPIYLLLANPWRLDTKHYENKEINFLNWNIQRKIILNNLKWIKNKFPFYYLDENFKDSWWYNWWNHCFKFLIENKDISRQKISENFFCLEIQWYHSYNFQSNITKELDSVNYTKYLLNEAMKDDKIIILSRSVQNWFNLVDWLQEYDKCYFLATNYKVEIRNTTLSPKWYNEILNILNR